jgi:hypothetical protein
MARVIEAVDFRESLQPGLTALLAHDAIRAPGSEHVIEPFVSRTHGFLATKGLTCAVKALQIADAEVRSGRHHPGIAAFTQDMREAVVVLEQKGRLCRQGSAYIVPVYEVGKINIEVCDHWSSRQSHVSRRGKVRLLDILQLADERLLRRTTRTGIPFDRTLVDHDRKGKAGMSFRLRHNQFRGLVDAVVGAVPVDNHAVNSAADHICDLPMDLFGVSRPVADA